MAPTAPVGYVNRIGIALEAQEAQPKKKWNVMPERMLERMPIALEELLKPTPVPVTVPVTVPGVAPGTVTVAVPGTVAEREKKTVTEREKKTDEKKKKKEWKPVPLASPATSHTRPAVAAPKCKSIKEIQEEELEKKRMKEEEAEFNQARG